MDEKNRPVTRAIYNIIGINPDGYKDLLGMYISKSEGANFWLSCLSDIQSRGVKDIIIACTDNLTGFRMPLEVFFLKQLSRLVLFTRFATPLSMWPVRIKRNS